MCISTQETQDEWKWKEYYDVKWLNEPAEGTKELALVNDPIPDDEENLSPYTLKVGYLRSLEKHYSHLVILAQVPKMVDRVILET